MNGKDGQIMENSDLFDSVEMVCKKHKVKNWDDLYQLMAIDYSPSQFQEILDFIGYNPITFRDRRKSNPEYRKVVYNHKIILEHFNVLRISQIGKEQPKKSHKGESIRSRLLKMLDLSKPLFQEIVNSDVHYAKIDFMQKLLEWVNEQYGTDYRSHELRNIDYGRILNIFLDLLENSELKKQYKAWYRPTISRAQKRQFQAFSDAWEMQRNWTNNTTKEQRDGRYLKVNF